jgi:alpha-1,3-mannosylglycoprotein beta-1,4-N-acetylglucosaminyltransferase A/B
MRTYSTKYLGVFYTQLEDDILSKPGFVTTMLKFANDKIANKQTWLVIEFCQLGFIGKMFNCDKLPWLAQFFIMFYAEKPVDWLLSNFVTTKACSFNMNQVRFHFSLKCISDLSSAFRKNVR